jgi:hypothetical protein
MRFIRALGRKKGSRREHPRRIPRSNSPIGCTRPFPIFPTALPRAIWKMRARTERQRALGEFDRRGGFARARIAEEERDSKDCVQEKEDPLKEPIETDDRQKTAIAEKGAAEKRILQNEEQAKHESF